MSFRVLLCLAPLWLATAALGAEAPALPVRLTVPLEFATKSVSGRITPAVAQQLLKEKVKVGSDEPDAYEFLLETVPAKPAPEAKVKQATTPPVEDERRIRVETVEEYRAAMKRGAYTMTTFDRAMQSWFDRTSCVVLFATQAIPSKQTRLAPGWLVDMSVKILGFDGPDEEAALKAEVAKGRTLIDYRNAGKLKEFKGKAHELRFASETKEYIVQEFARGDYDRDGFEDALISVTAVSTDGSSRDTEWYLARWKSKQARPSIGPLVTK
ncbi:MAG: hypothetical protein ABMA26_22815 [Limisphaerales bacterium]